MKAADKCAHLQGKPYCPDCCFLCLKKPDRLPCGVICEYRYNGKKCEERDKFLIEREIDK
jgi:hypothetical protein